MPDDNMEKFKKDLMASGFDRFYEEGMKKDEFYEKVCKLVGKDREILEYIIEDSFTAEPPWEILK